MAIAPFLLLWPSDRDAEIKKKCKHWTMFERGSSCNDAESDLDDDPGGAIYCIVCNGATSPLFHHVSRINAGLSALPISQPPPHPLSCTYPPAPTPVSNTA